MSAEDAHQGAVRIARLIAEIEAYDPESIMRRAEPGVLALETRIDQVLDRTLGTETIERSRYRRASMLHMAVAEMGSVFGRATGPNLPKIRSEFVSMRETAIALLNDVARFLAEMASEEEQQREPEEKRNPLKVFVVHGHDELVKSSVCEFIRKLGLDPIILHEQPNRGRTIIEKFHEEAEDAAFAVVLMTADDEGAAKGAEIKPRARQNVIFELGFFNGALGRHRVAALVSQGVERPSDYDGVLFIPIDGDWKLKLAKEMKAAGVPVDLNRAM